MCYPCAGTIVLSVLMLVAETNLSLYKKLNTLNQIKSNWSFLKTHLRMVCLCCTKNFFRRDFLFWQWLQEVGHLQSAGSTCAREGSQQKHVHNVAKQNEWIH